MFKNKGFKQLFRCIIYTTKYNKMLQKKQTFYECIDCEYISHNKNNFEKHLLTRKHIHKQNYNKKLQNVAAPQS